MSGLQLKKLLEGPTEGHKEMHERTLLSILTRIFNPKAKGLGGYSIEGRNISGVEENNTGLS